MGDTITPADGATAAAVPKIAGISALKGLAIYAATFAFAGLYGYFIYKISTTIRGTAQLDGVLVSAAAALAGVLGSAFALEVGLTTQPGETNQRLAEAWAAKVKADGKPGPRLRLQKALTLDPTNVECPSWPKTIGIWVYAIVAAAVAITYSLNPSNTPEMIKALAVAFAGYVLALLAMAYRSEPSVSPAAAAAQPIAPKDEAAARLAVVETTQDEAAEGH
jgi:hypothetical protein